jgi:hypothetical protein
MIHNINPNIDHWRYCWNLKRRATDIKDERDFMIKFMHRQINTRYMLEIYGIEPNDTCSHCNTDVETIEHAYYFCTYNNNLINHIITWINSKCEININLTEFEFFIGIRNELNNEMLYLYNRILWLSKYFIYLKRKDRAEINLDEFLRWLDRYVKHYKEMNIFVSPRVTNDLKLFKVLGLL